VWQVEPVPPIYVANKVHASPPIFPLNVISIQSRVAFGHVGNAAAVFILQRLGHDVWPIDTVTFSNQTAHPSWRGRVVPPAELAELVEGLADLGLLAHCDAVLSGYLGDAGTAAVVADLVARVRAANPEAIYACDPVLGERSKGLYVRPGVAEAMADLLVPEADILLPNAFELSHLTGMDPTTLDEARSAAEALRRLQRRPGIVVATGIEHREDGAERLEVLLAGPSGALRAGTPRLDVPAHGAGDTFSALFLGHYLRNRDAPRTLAAATDAIFNVLSLSRQRGGFELALVPSQDHFDPETPSVKTKPIEG
jgi:pyridoxine kinase